MPWGERHRQQLRPGTERCSPAPAPAQSDAPLHWQGEPMEAFQSLKGKIVQSLKIHKDVTFFFFFWQTLHFRASRLQGTKEVRAGFPRQHCRMHMQYCSFPYISIYIYAYTCTSACMCVLTYRYLHFLQAGGGAGQRGT